MKNSGRKRINTASMKADGLRTVLSFHDDFLNENTIVEHTKGPQSILLPKFHRELNPIERVWGQAKVYCQAYTNFTLGRLQQVINPALDSITIDNIQKFSGNVGITEKHTENIRLERQWQK